MGESLKLKMEFHEDKSTHSEDPISEKPESTYQALPPSLDVTRLLADERLRAEKYKLLYQNLKSTQLRMEGDLEVIREEFRQLQHEKETAEQEHRRAMEIVKEQVAAKISQLKEFEMKGNLPGEDWRAPGHKPCAELLERISGLELRNLQLEQRLKMVLDEQEMLVTHLKQKDLEAEKRLQERTLRFKVQMEREKMMWEKEMKEKEEALKDCQTSLEPSLEENRSLLQHLRTCQAENAELRAQIAFAADQKEAEDRFMRGQISQLRKNLDALQAEKRNLDRELEMMHRRAQRTEESLREAEKDVREKRLELSQLQVQLETLKDEKKRANFKSEFEISRLKAKYTSLKESMSSDLEGLQEDLERREGKIGELEALLIARDAEIESRNQELLAKCNELSLHIDCLDLRDRLQKSQELVKQMENKKEELEKVMEEIEKWRKRDEEWKEEKGRLVQRISELEASLTSATENHSQETKQLSQEASTLKEEVKRLKKLQKRLKEPGLDMGLAHLRLQLGSLQRLEDLFNSASVPHRGKEELEAEVEKLHNRLDTLLSLHSKDPVP